jgi:hypothetical protein
LRKLVSVVVLKYALTPHKVKVSLLKHIAHRFAQPGASEELQQAELPPLPDGATQEEMVRKWLALMAATGAICFLRTTQPSANACILFNCKHMNLLVVGWGDTATMIVLSNTLYIDVSLRKLPQKFKHLRFRRCKESSARKLYLRYIKDHFVVYKPRTAGTKVQPGSAADEEHYLTGSHDVATGGCVITKSSTPAS